MSSLDVMYKSTKHDWGTPQALFDLLDREFNFSTDVCATAANAKVPRYYTPEQNALAQRWRGVCWMNPPYGREIGKWLAHAFAAAQSGATVVALVPARTDTHWWWSYCRYAEVRLLRGRLKFEDGSNKPSCAPFPSAIVVFDRLVMPAVVYWDWRALV